MNDSTLLSIIITTDITMNRPANNAKLIALEMCSIMLFMLVNIAQTLHSCPMQSWAA